MIPGATVGEGLAAARDSLRAGGIDAWGLEARLLMAEAVGASVDDVFAHPGRPLSDDARDALFGMVRRRLTAEPIAYILGRREFWSLSFKVSPATLIPRPETELIVSSVLARYAPTRADPRILDLGTGSGCILLSLLHELPGATGVGVDISPAALAIARANAEDLGLASRAHFVCADWADAVCGAFDVVVANPPYIRTRDIGALMADVRRFEPRVALDGGDDGLAAYRRIFERIGDLAAANTLIAMEIPADAVENLCSIVQRVGLDVLATERDLAGRPRCMLVRGGNDRSEKKALGNGALPV